MTSCWCTTYPSTLSQKSAERALRPELTESTPPKINPYPKMTCRCVCMCDPD